jgi:AI-2 transport system permease protein
MSTSSTSDPARAVKRGFRSVIGGRELTLLAACLGAAVIFTLLSRNFLTVTNLTVVARNCVELLLVGLGMTLVITMGGIDISLGMTVGIAAIAIGNLLTAGFDPLLAAIVGPLVGGALGLVTASVIVLGRIPAIVGTLGLLGVYRTAIYLMLGGQWISGLSSELGQLLNGRIAWIFPVNFAVIAGAYAAAFLMLRRMPFGLHLLAIGAAEESARLSGVKVRRTRFLAYVMSGFLAGLAASFYVGTYRNVEMTIGGTLVLDAVAASVLGGTSILGGRASLSGTILGVVLIRLLQNGFTLIGVPSLWQSVVTGILLILVLSLENVDLIRGSRTREIAV